MLILKLDFGKKIIRCLIYLDIFHAIQDFSGDINQRSRRRLLDNINNTLHKIKICLKTELNIEDKYCFPITGYCIHEKHQEM